MTKEQILNTLFLLTPNMFGDTMEIHSKIKSPKNSYFLPQIDVDIFTGQCRRYNIIDGRAHVFTYLTPGNFFLAQKYYSLH